MKQCGKCKQTKSLLDFSKNKNKKDGIQDMCKLCVANYVSSIAGKSSRLFSGCKRRAKSSGGKVLITRQWLEDRLTKGVCELTGLPFDFSGRGEFSRKPYAPSVDRKDPQNPDYTLENTRVVLWAVNCAMAEYGEKIMFPIFKALTHAKQKSVTSIPTGHYPKIENHTKYGAIPSTWFGEVSNNAHNYSGADAGKDVDHSAQEDSGDGVAHRNRKVEPSPALTGRQDNGDTDPEISRVELRGGRLFD